MKISAHFLQKNGGDPTFEWTMARVGVVTASEFDQLITPEGKPRTGEMPKTYLARKLAEKWQGGPLLAFNTFAMEQGNIMEEQAIPFAEFEYGLKIKQVGFVSALEDKIGCSPDGLIGFDADMFSKEMPTNYKLRGDESGIEIKCPNIETHIKYLLNGELPKDYVAQVQGSMFITGCTSWKFLSYRRHLPALFVAVECDHKFIANLDEAIQQFLADFDVCWNRLCEINGGPPERKRYQYQPKPEPIEDRFDTNN